MTLTNAENIEIVSELQAREEAALREAHDELFATNWLSAFFNPLGAIPRVVFTRGQVILWIVRLLAFVVAFVMGAFMQQQDAAGVILLVAFVGSAVVSLIMHIQRLEHAKRPTWLAALVILPVLIAGALTAMQLMAIQAKIDAARAAAIAAMQAQQAGEAAPVAEEPAPPPAEAAAAEGEAASEGEAAEGEGEGAAAEGQQQQAQGQRQGGPPQRQGPQGPPPLPIWAMMALPPWILLGALASIFTWAYAARVKRRPDTFESY